MVDPNPQFEISDLLGSTAHFNGTVGTSAISVPASPGNRIAEVIISCPPQGAGRKLLVSFDGGTTFLTMENPSALDWTVRGTVRQLVIKGSTANVLFEILMNREES